jgi:hypothetical protein
MSNKVITKGFDATYIQTRGVVLSSERNFYLPADLKAGDKVKIILDSVNPFPVFLPKAMKEQNESLPSFPTFAQHSKLSDVDASKYKSCLQGTANGKPFKSFVTNYSSRMGLSYEAVAVAYSYEDNKGVTQTGIRLAV